MKKIISEKEINRITDKYSHMIYRLAYARVQNQSDADDIFQEVFLRYIKKHPDFDNETHEKAWFIRVTINCTKNLLRLSFLHRTESLDDIGEKSADKYGEIPGFDDGLPDIDYYMNRLAPGQRTLIHLYYYEKMNTEEIAEVLQTRPGNVRTGLKRARDRMKKLMEGDELDVG